MWLKISLSQLLIWLAFISRFPLHHPPILCRPQRNPSILNAFSYIGSSLAIFHAFFQRHKVDKLADGINRWKIGADIQKKKKETTNDDMATTTNVHSKFSSRLLFDCSKQYPSYESMVDLSVEFQRAIEVKERWAPDGHIMVVANCSM